jgi:hypothetical protein
VESFLPVPFFIEIFPNSKEESLVAGYCDKNLLFATVHIVTYRIVPCRFCLSLLLRQELAKRMAKSYSPDTRGVKLISITERWGWLFYVTICTHRPNYRRL